MTVKLICVGRLKEKFYGDACAEFKKRISRFADVNIMRYQTKGRRSSCQKLRWSR